MPDVANDRGYSERQSAQGLEQAQPSQSSPPPTLQSNNAQVGVAASVAAVPDPASQAATGPQIADDTDLIEKEWVIKAKEIVERTKHDPYQQNKEVELMKADYMHKRYNKEIKLTED